MSGFSYPPPIFLSSTYNPAFYLSLDPSGFLSYAYAQTLYVSRNDYRLSYITGITLGQGGANQALTLDGTRSVTNINSLTASSISVASLSGLSTLTLSGTLTAGTVNATSGLQVNGTSYDLSLLDRVNVTTIGQAQNSKALVLDSNRSATNINSLTFDSAGTGIVCSTLKFWNAAGNAPDTFAHTYYVGILEGGASNSKAVVLNSTKDYSGIRNLSCSGTLTISTSISTPSITCDTITKAGTIALSPATLNLNPTTLQIAGTAVTASAAELNKLAGCTATTTELNKLAGCTATTADLNYLDITTEGVGQASKALVLDSALGINNIANLRVKSTSTTALLAGASMDKYDLTIRRSISTQTPFGIGFIATTLSAGDTTYTPHAAICVQRNPLSGAGGDLMFGTKDSTTTGPVLERMRISYDGKVGIATTSPPAKFGVVGDATTLSGSWQRVCYFANDNATPITGELQIYNGATGNSTGMWLGTTTDDPVRFGVGNSTMMYLNGSGRLGIGISSLGWSPEATIHAGGWIYAHDGFYRRTSSSSASLMFAWAGVGYGGIGWDSANGQRVRIGITNADGTWAGYPNSVYGGPYTNGSDRRLKTDIRDCPHGLSVVMQMRPRVFRWKISEESEPDSIGFIAQELQPLVPEVVSGDESCAEDENGMIAYPMGIEMASITAVLCKAIQELTARVEALEEALKNM